MKYRSVLNLILDICRFRDMPLNYAQNDVFLALNQIIIYISQIYLRVFPSFVILFKICFSPCTPVPSINKTYRHDIAEILFNHHRPNQPINMQNLRQFKKGFQMSFKLHISLERFA